MVILHIASISESKSNGINVVVPQHVIINQNRKCGYGNSKYKKNRQKLQGVNYFYNEIKTMSF